MMFHKIYIRWWVRSLRVRNVIDGCHPLLPEVNPAVVSAMLEAAAVMGEITSSPLQEAMPPADDEGRVSQKRWSTRAIRRPMLAITW
jgi:hypothetical protein